MTGFRSGTKGDLNRRRRKQTANLLLDVIKESVPTANLSKSKRAGIVDLFKDLYHDYWTVSKRDLVVVPAMNAVNLNLIILGYTQHLATIAKAVHKTSNKNAWSHVWNEHLYHYMSSTLPAPQGNAG